MGITTRDKVLSVTSLVEMPFWYIFAFIAGGLIVGWYFGYHSGEPDGWRHSLEYQESHKLR